MKSNLSSNSITFNDKFTKTDNLAYAVNGVNWIYSFVPAIAQQYDWLANTYTIEYIIKDFGSQAGTGYVMYFDNRTIIGVTSTSVFWRAWNGTNLDVIATIPVGVDTTKWVYIRCEYDKENAQRRIYVNNTEIYNAATVTNLTYQYRNFLIHFTNLTANGNFFSGKCRSITAYPRLLEAVEIQHRYTAVGEEYLEYDPDTDTYNAVIATEPIIRMPFTSYELEFIRPKVWYEFEKTGRNYGTNSNNLIMPFATANYDAYITV